nr:DUF1643 domain-containing protein [Pontibacillus sp. ALD_SL1]
MDSRTWLRATINPEGSDNITYIGMNPSKATETVSDNTINNMLKFTKDLTDNLENKMKIKNVIVTNIIPLYTSNHSNLKKQIDKVKVEVGEYELDRVLEINLQRIIKAIRLSKYVVLCWGDCYINKKMHLVITSSILRKLREFESEYYVLNFEGESTVLTLELQPRHFGYTKFPKEIIEVKIEPSFYIDI